MNSTHLKLALAAAGKGWPVFPLAGEEVEETADRKRPHPDLPMGGFKNATTDPEIIRAWWKQWPGAWAGVWPGAAGLLVIDLDVKEGARGVDNWLKIPETGGELGQCVVSTPSGGVHVYYQLPKGHPEVGNTPGSLPPGIDVRSAKGYVALYELPDAAPAPAPQWLLRKLKERKKRRDVSIPWIAPTTSEVSTQDPGKVARNPAMMEIAGHLRAKGLPFEDIQSVLEIVNLKAFPEPKPQYKVDEIVNYLRAKDPYEGDDAGESRFAMRLFDHNALIHKPVPPMLVDNLLVKESLAALVSKPGVGKSFIALDLAMSIATGQREFLGLGLRGCGAVVYVLGEGSGRFGLRLRAWDQFHNNEGGAPFYWIDGPVDLMSKERVAQFIDLISPVNPALIVFDTLSRCMVGVEENKQEAMTVAVENADRIKRKVPGSTVLILHHLNAAGTRERGSTVFGGALDLTLFLRPKQRRVGEQMVDIKDRCLLSVTKAKDVERMDPVSLRQRIVALDGMFEENGEQSTSLVWVPSEDDPNEPHDEEATIDVLRREITQKVANNPGISPSAIKDAISGANDTKWAAIDALLADGVLRQEVFTKGKTTRRALYVAEADAHH